MRTWTFDGRTDGDHGQRASGESPMEEGDEENEGREYKRRRERRGESRTNSISGSSSVRSTPGSVTLGTSYMGYL